MSIVLSILLLILFCIEPAYVISITDDQTATNGSTVTIECIAGGSPSVFTYQWMKNGVTIAGETRSSLTISSVTTVTLENTNVHLLTQGVTQIVPLAFLVSMVSSQIH